MFPVQSVIGFGIVAGVLAGAALWRTPWGRQEHRSLVAGVATTIGFVAWNLVLALTNATSLDVDAPVIPLSFQDVGSGVLAFAGTAVALGLGSDRDQPAWRVVGAAAIAGLVTMVFDIFVL